MPAALGLGKKACAYGVRVSRATIFAYVSGNPLLFIDPEGLQVRPRPIPIGADHPKIIATNSAKAIPIFAAAFQVLGRGGVAGSILKGSPCEGRWRARV